MEEYETSDNIEEIINENSDEDDYTEYFMQPVNAYNMKRKIDTANKILFAEEYDTSNKKTVVQFSVNLYEFEPDYYATDDNDSEPSIIEEVDEIESDKEEDNLNTITNHLEAAHDDDQIEIVNQISNLLLEPPSPSNSEECDTHEDANQLSIVSDNLSDRSGSVNDSLSVSEVCNTNDKNKTTSINRTPVRRNSPKEIYCEKYCKEFHSLYSQADTTSTTYEPELLLKLHRQCCENLNKSNQLPTYNGLNSEYGLSKKQLERKIKNTQRKLKKEQEKKDREQKQQMQRMEECEQSFCNWLRTKINKKFRKKDSGKKKKEYKRIVYRTTAINFQNNYFRNNIIIPLDNDVEEKNIKIRNLIKRNKSRGKRSFNIHFIVS